MHGDTWEKKLISKNSREFFPTELVENKEPFLTVVGIFYFAQFYYYIFGTMDDAFRLYCPR